MPRFGEFAEWSRTIRAADEQPAQEKMALSDTHQLS
jgi:hypothetical protein